MWHNDAQTRKQIGLPLEDKFAKEFSCECGGTFVKSKRYWMPDLTCDTCGRQIDIKFSPQTERTGNIAISANAWHKYTNDTMIVTYVTGSWFGMDKEDIEENCDCIHDAIDSTHPNSGGYNGGRYDSSFYLIPVNSLLVIG